MRRRPWVAYDDGTIAVVAHETRSLDELPAALARATSFRLQPR